VASSLIFVGVGDGDRYAYRLGVVDRSDDFGVEGWNSYYHPVK
jgi:hypothetical protein